MYVIFVVIAQYLVYVISYIYNIYNKKEIDGVNPRIEQTLGKTMIAGNSNIINCSVHHNYCRESSLEPNSSAEKRVANSQKPGEELI